ncbi:rod shape-determining protein [Micromonospora globbae]|uniref:Rod shape-determining protein n=1 Tax=Micromonospora globbae TaxID=1894969 RepID=A0ABZ1SDL1_9ACTN|nr:rod shape-determining protein [Micromonospora globbae]
MTAPVNLSPLNRPAGRPTTGAGGRPAATPTAVAVDLGSCTVGVWASHRGTLTGPCGDAFSSAGRLVRRGRVVDVDGCALLLDQLIRRYDEPLPAGAVVVACRPLLAAESDEAAMRRVLDTVFAPSRILFVDAVRAAAIGSGAAAGTLLMADIGAQVSEVAVLSHGRVVAARRANVGTMDLAHGTAAGLLGDVVANQVRDLRRDLPAADLAAAKARGMLLVGDGALQPDLTTALSKLLRLRVHRAPTPRTAALNGAALAAMAALRHPAPPRTRTWPVS